MHGPHSRFEVSRVSTSLLSPGFLALAFAAIVLLAVLHGTWRQVAFLALNLVFIAALLGAAGSAITLGFTLLGYALARLGAHDRRAGAALILIPYIALFAWLRGYDLLEWLRPETLLTGIIGTIGLSFLFFKIVHVIVDARGGTVGRLEFLTFVNYCLNFTTFMMGPIQRYQDFRGQWNGETLAIPLTFEAHLDAVLRMLFGFVKVYVIAGFFAAHGLQPDTQLLQLSLTGLIVQSYAFWIFLYLNFSGYCDIVIGAGSLFGVRPPENFDKPFLARNISDFWQRQHRSLTLWLTDYVFTPTYKELLATPFAARHRLLVVNAALMATMIVSGLWHGTTISFLLFGVAHGLFFVIHRSWDTLLSARLGKAGVQRFRALPLVRAAGIALTFNATAAAFIFFQLRPDRIADAVSQIASR